jgi:L-threonylcarbamoyladenylate synthase
MKPYQTLYIDIEAVDNAVSLWRTGELVALPTETVYGLGADACNGEAVAKIYQVKSRPQFNPLIVHVATTEIAKRYVQWNSVAETAAAAFWPGPLTLVLARAAGCPISELVSAGGHTIAIRVPAHPVAQQLLTGFDGGIAAPSANRSGRVSPTTAQHVLDELGERISMVVDGGPCVVGLESTVLDVSGEAPMLLRPGSITHGMLEEALGIPVLRHTGGSKIASPGQLESHYAPSIPVRLNAIDVKPDEALLAFGAPFPTGAQTAILNLSPNGNLVEAAAHLFEYMRLLDNPVYSGIAVMAIPMEGIGEAINDRLRRAAHR